jgi:hypothetical protein
VKGKAARKLVGKVQLQNLNAKAKVMPKEVLQDLVRLFDSTVFDVPPLNINMY